MKLRNEHSVESMNDKTILEKVLGRSSVRLHGWGRDPTIGSNTMDTNQKSNRPTYDEVLDALEALQGTCALMQQALIENNIMLPSPSTTRAYLKMIHQILSLVPMLMSEVVLVFFSTCSDL